MERLSKQTESFINDRCDSAACLRAIGRGALLMLFLFSDVSERDAPTIIRVGSHLDVARLLASVGESGLSFMAQPPLLTRREFNIHRPAHELCPVEIAIRKGLDPSQSK